MVPSFTIDATSGRHVAKDSSGAVVYEATSNCDAWSCIDRHDIRQRVSGDLTSVAYQNKAGLDRSKAEKIAPEYRNIRLLTKAGDIFGSWYLSPLNLVAAAKASTGHRVEFHVLGIVATKSDISQLKKAGGAGYAESFIRKHTPKKRGSVKKDGRRPAVETVKTVRPATARQIELAMRIEGSCSTFPNCPTQEAITSMDFEGIGAFIECWLKFMPPLPFVLAEVAKFEAMTGIAPFQQLGCLTKSSAERYVSAMRISVAGLGVADKSPSAIRAAMALPEHASVISERIAYHMEALEKEILCISDGAG